MIYPYGKFDNIPILKIWDNKKADKMTKTQTWANVQKLLNGYEFEGRDALLSDLSKLLEPKKGGSNSRPANIIKDDRTYYYCRYSDAHYLSDDMIYQNDAKRDERKDKGYSKIGISLWNKGQKYIKDTKEALFVLMMNEDERPMDEDFKEEMEALKKIVSDFKGANYGELEQFITDEQRATRNAKGEF